MYVGADYYPEHWPTERWTTDAKLMQEAGFNLVRMAEFAWTKMEPMEGVFEFGWLDEVLGLLAEREISAILCTPTATMPSWVPRKYPEVMAMGPAGNRTVWGVRKNNCFNSGAYRLLSERITEAMAEHFKDTPNLIGWQTDNEFGGPVCFCETCRADFQDWLRAKYGTLDQLNRAWGTHFWSQQYTTWGEIQIPSATGSGWRLAGDGHLSTHNPSLCLDWQRYFSHLNVRFQHDQVKILRRLCPNHFITHNCMGFFSDLNYYDLAQDLDFVSWDNYPVWTGPPDHSRGPSAAAAVMRGLKRKNFWIMEQTAGPSGWSSFGRNPRPGELRKIAYQQLANGADGQVWFRWRTCTAGREQYWHGLLGHDGKPLRRYREAAQTAHEYHRLAPELEGTTLQPQVAIIYDYESIWALRIQPGYAENTYHAALLRYWSALARAGLSADMIPPTADLSQYKAVLAPDFHVVDDAAAARISDYVKAGGVFLGDSRLAVKTETNLCHDRTLPGLLAEPLGVSIEEYEAIDSSLEYAVVGRSAIKGTFTALHYVDWINPNGADVIAGFDQWHLQPYAAVTRNTFGRGAAYYVGAPVKEEAFYDQLIADLLATAKVKSPLTPPDGVEVTVREGAGKRLLFLINHTEQTQTVRVPAAKLELLTGEQTGETLSLDRFGVAVIKLQ